MGGREGGWEGEGQTDRGRMRLYLEAMACSCSMLLLPILPSSSGCRDTNEVVHTWEAAAAGGLGSVEGVACMIVPLLHRRRGAEVTGYCKESQIVTIFH